MLKGVMQNLEKLCREDIVLFHSTNKSSMDYSTATQSSSHYHVQGAAKHPPLFYNMLEHVSCSATKSILICFSNVLVATSVPGKSENLTCLKALRARNDK